jgi:hypothetical protein
VPTMRAQHSKGFMRCRSGEARWKTNENARALISMMARSTNRSNQRPDTLMQGRKAARLIKPLATHGRTIHPGQIRPSRGAAEDGRSATGSERTCALRAAALQLAGKRHEPFRFRVGAGFSVGASSLATCGCG